MDVMRLIRALAELSLADYGVSEIVVSASARRKEIRLVLGGTRATPRERNVVN